MGWDAYSSVKINWDVRGGKIIDAETRRLFKNAANYVQRKANSVDGNLRLGGLDLSLSGEMLQRATGRSVYVEKPWNPETVFKLNKSANWNFPIDLTDENEPCAYWSARKFLQVCAKAGLSIKFSW